MTRLKHILLAGTMVPALVLLPLASAFAQQGPDTGEQRGAPRQRPEGTGQRPAPGSERAQPGREAPGRAAPAQRAAPTAPAAPTRAERPTPAERAAPTRAAPAERAAPAVPAAPTRAERPTPAERAAPTRAAPAERAAPAAPAAPTRAERPKPTERAAPAAPAAPTRAERPKPTERAAPVAPTAPIQRSSPAERGAPAAERAAPPASGTRPVPGQPATNAEQRAPAAERPGEPARGPAASRPGAPVGAPNSAGQNPPGTNQQRGERGGIGPGGAAAIGAAAGFAGGFLAATGAQNLDAIRRDRRETVEDGRTYIREPGRTIVDDGGSSYIVHDENDRFRELGYDVHRERDGSDFVDRIDRPDGTQIITYTTADGRLLRRIRRGRDGRAYVLIDNSYNGGLRSYQEDIVDLPPPRVGIPRDRYDVDYRDVDEGVLYDTFIAPPLQAPPRRYTLDQIRYSPDVRRYVRSVDINTINFDSGSWIVPGRGDGQASGPRRRHQAHDQQEPEHGFPRRGLHRRDREPQRQSFAVGPPRPIGRGNPVEGFRRAAGEPYDPGLRPAGPEGEHAGTLGDQSSRGRAEHHASARGRRSGAALSPRRR